MLANKTKSARRRETNAAFHRRHPKRELLHGAKRRAKERNRKFDVCESDFEIPTHCPILGIKLVRGVGKMHAGSPTLDEIEIGKGYIRGNIQVISAKANIMKSDATAKELLDFAKWVLDVYEP